MSHGPWRGDRVVVYIGLGSNLSDPPAQLYRARRALAALADSRLLACSRLYRSRPLGPVVQPDFTNAVVALETTMVPLDLLDALQAIEQDQGRVRVAQRWGPRTLDLDIVLYAGQVIDLPRLQVPHPGLPERNFVLYPLHDIAPELVIPGQGPLAVLLQHCPRTGLEQQQGADHCIPGLESRVGGGCAVWKP